MGLGHHLQYSEEINVDNSLEILNIYSYICYQVTKTPVTMTDYRVKLNEHELEMIVNALVAQGRQWGEAIVRSQLTAGDAPAAVILRENLSNKLDFLRVLTDKLNEVE